MQRDDHNCPLSNVLDAGGRVDFNLATALPQQELDGSKIALVDGEVLLELGAGKRLKVLLLVLGICQSQKLMREREASVRVRSNLGFAADAAQALPVEREDLALEA